MLSRRACAIALGQGLVLGPAFAASPRRLALLLAAPWEGESFLGDDLALMQEGLRARGLTAAELISVLEPLDRERVASRLEEVSRRIAGWQSGEVFLYYNGHGMYAPAGGGWPEPGLQLDRKREQASSALLWRDLFAILRAPPGVRVMVLPDCCHTNLLVGRLPTGTTALIMKSDPQGSLNCRSGTSLFGEAPRRVRHGVISYYAGRTIAAADTVGAWLAAQDGLAAHDVAAGKLEKFRRVSLMVEGDASLRVLPG
jgi:hypothetical protein